MIFPSKKTQLGKLLITGMTGSGKSHYAQNTLLPAIFNTYNSGVFVDLIDGSLEEKIQKLSVASNPVFNGSHIKHRLGAAPTNNPIESQIVLSDETIDKIEEMLKGKEVLYLDHFILKRGEGDTAVDKESLKRFGRLIKSVDNCVVIEQDLHFLSHPDVPTITNLFDFNLRFEGREFTAVKTPALAKLQSMFY